MHASLDDLITTIEVEAEHARAELQRPTTRAAHNRIVGVLHRSLQRLEILRNLRKRKSTPTQRAPQAAR
jgi:hypothetical protein